MGILALKYLLTFHPHTFKQTPLGLSLETRRTGSLIWREWLPAEPGTACPTLGMSLSVMCPVALPCVSLTSTLCITEFPLASFPVPLLFESALCPFSALLCCVPCYTLPPAAHVPLVELVRAGLLHLACFPQCCYLGLSIRDLVVLLLF